jgi:acetyltransferase-like isoleucine patch superfamily enzyme
MFKYLKMKLTMSPIYYRMINIIRTRAWVNSEVPKTSYISQTAQIIGLDQILIGNHTTISDDVWININHRLNKEASLIIGDNCIIGRRAFITVAKKVKIGDYTSMGVNCLLLGAHHDYKDPLQPYTIAKIDDQREIEIGTNCFLGAGVTIMAGVSIGHGSVIGAGTIVTRNIPPFSLVIGNPGSIIKRYSFIYKRWETFSENKPMDDHHFMDENNYNEYLRGNYGDIGPYIFAGTSRVGHL